MISLTRPRWSDIDKYLRGLRSAPLSYGPAGLTRSEFEKECALEPEYRSRFRKDSLRLCLGSGKQTFEAACQAIKAWRMFPEPLCRVYWPSPSLEIDHVVGVLFHAPGFWSLNPCRIVAVESSARLFGFAYGTLPGHMAAGEEAFLIRHHDDDSVWYELTVHSRPQQWLTWLGYPYLLRRQSDFRRASGRAMVETVSEIEEAKNQPRAYSSTRQQRQAFSHRA